MVGILFVKLKSFLGGLKLIEPELIERVGILFVRLKFCLTGLNVIGITTFGTLFVKLKSTLAGDIVFKPRFLFLPRNIFVFIDKA